MIGIVLVIKPPIIFPENSSFCHETVQVFEDENPKNYTLGVALCLACAVVLGLISVCIAYLKVRI